MLALSRTRDREQRGSVELSAHFQALECDFLDVAVVDLREELGIGDPVLRCLAHLEHLEGNEKDEDQDHPEDHCFERLTGFSQARFLRRSLGKPVRTVIRIAIVRHNVLKSNKLWY